MDRTFLEAAGNGWWVCQSLKCDGPVTLTLQYAGIIQRPANSLQVSHYFTSLAVFLPVHLLQYCKNYIHIQNLDNFNPL